MTACVNMMLHCPRNCRIYHDCCYSPTPAIATSSPWTAAYQVKVERRVTSASKEDTSSASNSVVVVVVVVVGVVVGVVAGVVVGVVGAPGSKMVSN